MSKEALEIMEKEFDEEVVQEAKPVLVDFYAPWCAPCRAVLPVMDELAGEYDGKLKIVKINVDENPNLASRFDIMAVPTLIIFKGGQQVKSISGALSRDQIVDFVEKNS